MAMCLKMEKLRTAIIRVRFAKNGGTDKFIVNQKSFFFPVLKESREDSDLNG